MVVVGLFTLKTEPCSGPAKTERVICGLPEDLGGVRTIRPGGTDSLGTGALIYSSFLQGVNQKAAICDIRNIKVVFCISAKSIVFRSDLIISSWSSKFRQIIAFRIEYLDS